MNLEQMRQRAAQWAAEAHLSADAGAALIAELMGDAFGRLFLEALAPERRQEVLHSGQLCSTDFQQALAYPPLAALIEQDNADWRRNRGFPPKGSRALLDSVQ